VPTRAAGHPGGRLCVFVHRLGELEDMSGEIEELPVLVILLLHGPPLLVGDDLALGVIYQ
jgi:hypothetical protein